MTNTWMIIKRYCYLPRKVSCGSIFITYSLLDGVYATEAEARTVADSLPRKEHARWGYGGTDGEEFGIVPEEVVSPLKELDGDDKVRALKRLYKQSKYARPPWAD